MEGAQPIFGFFPVTLAYRRPFVASGLPSFSPLKPLNLLMPLLQVCSQQKGHACTFRSLLVAASLCFMSGLPSFLRAKTLVFNSTISFPFLETAVSSRDTHTLSRPCWRLPSFVFSISYFLLAALWGLWMYASQILIPGLSLGFCQQRGHACTSRSLLAAASLSFIPGLPSFLCANTSVFNSTLLLPFLEMAVSSRDTHTLSRPCRRLPFFGFYISYSILAALRGLWKYAFLFSIPGFSPVCGQQRGHACTYRSSLAAAHLQYLLGLPSFLRAYTVMFISLHSAPFKADTASSQDTQALTRPGWRLPSLIFSPLPFIPVALWGLWFYACTSGPLGPLVLIGYFPLIAHYRQQRGHAYIYRPPLAPVPIPYPPFLAFFSIIGDYRQIYTSQWRL